MSVNPYTTNTEYTTAQTNLNDVSYYRYMNGNTGYINTLLLALLFILLIYSMWPYSGSGIIAVVIMLLIGYIIGLFIMTSRYIYSRSPVDFNSQYIEFKTPYPTPTPEDPPA